MQKETIQKLKILILGLAIGIGGCTAAAITAPTTTPGTLGYSPIHQDPENQVKGGGLGLNSLIVSDHGAAFNTKLKIGSDGSTSPSTISSDMLYIGYSSVPAVSGPGTELTHDLILPLLKSTPSKNLCADASGTLILCP